MRSKDENPGNLMPDGNRPVEAPLSSAYTQATGGADRMPEKPVEQQMSISVASAHELTGPHSQGSAGQVLPKAACGCKSDELATSSAQITNRPAFVYAIGQIEVR